MEYNNVWTTPGDSSSEAEDSSSKAQDSSSMPDKPALGDVNGDGNIDIKDAVAVISHINGISPIG